MHLSVLAAVLLPYTYAIATPTVGHPDAIVKPPVETYQDMMNHMLKVFIDPDGLNMTTLVESLAGTSCIHRCSPNIGKVLDTLISAKPKDESALIHICTELAVAEVCIQEQRCVSPIFDIVRQMNKVVCIDDITGVGQSWECVQRAFADYRADCEKDCLSERTKDAVDPAKIPVDLESVCETSRCLLDCMQTSINKECRGKDANSTSIIDSILMTSSDGKLSSVFRGILPTHCIDIKKTQADNNQLFAVGGPQGQPSSVGKTRDLKRADGQTSTAASGDRIASTPLVVDGERMTLQCQMVDWERHVVPAPRMSTIVKLLKEQFDEDGSEPFMRADNSQPESEDEMAFERWMASLDAEQYRDMGYGAEVRDATSSALPPLWNILLAAAFPLIIFLQ